MVYSTGTTTYKTKGISNNMYIKMNAENYISSKKMAREWVKGKKGHLEEIWKERREHRRKRKKEKEA